MWQWQKDLLLLGGHDAGPLFNQIPRRAAPKPTWQGAARNRFLVRRTPKWANKRVLRAMRKLTTIYTRLTGVCWSMDHLVPLRHPLVCGFHCERNIRFAPLVDNLMKGNWHWPEMPETQMELFDVAILSDSNPSTLGAYLELSKALWPQGSKATEYLQRKIKESPRGPEEEVPTDESQMLYLLVNIHKGKTAAL